MEPYVAPPPRLPFFLGLMLRLVERGLGKRLVANRILARYPKAFWGSGILEALVAHDDREVPRRLLKLLRMQVSFAASCPFCIDMNSKEFAGEGISDEEILALRDLKGLDDVATFSPEERTALRYAREITATPLAFDPETMNDLKARFSDRAIVILASTAAQVNFWARLIQSLGVMPAGFSTECSILDLEAYSTRKAAPGRSDEAPAPEGREDFLRTVFETLPIPLFYKDREGRYIDANRAFIDRFVPSRDKPVGRTARDLNSPELAPLHATMDKALLASGGTRIYEVRLRDNLGLLRDVAVHKATFLDRNGEVAGLVGAIFDLTETKKAEERLSQSEQKWKSIFEHAADPILVLDFDGRIVAANPAATRALGYSQAELVGMSTRDLNDGGDKDEVPRRLELLLRTGAFEFETAIVAKNGARLEYEIHSRVVEFEGEERILSVYRDITARRKADHELHELLSRKELLLRETHHRVKNNMNVIASLLGMQASMSPNAAAREVLAEAVGRVESMMLLYDRLYRSDNVSSLSLKDYLPDLVKEAVAIFPKTVAVEVEHDVDDIALDARRLSPLGIVVNEIVTNSMKYAWKDRTEGRISVSAKRSDRGFVVTIGDDGVGMPEGTSSETSGGFGLSLIEMLARQLEAKLSVERGSGTRVTLEFSD